MDGKLVAAEVKHEVARRVKHLQQQGVKPWLSTVLVGDDPASATYLRAKHKACEEVGIKSENHHLPSDTPQNKLEALIDQLNHDDRVHQHKRLPYS
jgi:methylenetetrahydrofolate dehydrogenase (NADP+)/methenyltetrahydrofolate cyclohydrolase